MRKQTSVPAWGITERDGSLWNFAFYNKHGAMRFAVQGGMGATDYDRLENDRARWRFVYRRGTRIVRVKITLVKS